MIPRFQQNLPVFTGSFFCAINAPMFEIQCDVLPEQVGPPYNHVHHATLIRFFETARVRYLEQIGFPNEGFHAQQLFLVITAIDVKYKREVVPGKITITCENPRIDAKTVVVEQRIINSKGKVAVEAVVESQFLSGVTKRAVKPPEDFARLFCG
jgi:YbgC/YbaW family acyl-CoA thioester hydrolase